MVKPAMEPPAGHQSNFDNPNREMYYICIVSNAIAIPICSILVVLRLWVRYRLPTKLQVDDIACILGYIGFMGYCIICLLMLKYGGGLHQWDVPEDVMPQYYQTVYATIVNYGPTVFAIKAAILLFLARIFSPYKTYVKWIYGFLGIMAVYYVVMLFLKIFICRPIPMFWGATSDGKCFNQRALILTDNVISLLSDIVILLLPLPLTKKLQVGIMAKLKIAAVFGVGGIACVFSLVRLVFIVRDGETQDQTYKFVQINLTGIAECGIGVVCACLPLMPMLWKLILHKDKPGYSSSSRSQFEMMNSSQKRSRNATHNQASIHHNKAADSDENILITSGKSYVTTKVGGGDDITDRGSAGGDSAGFRASLDEARIYRTVEVHHDKMALQKVLQQQGYSTVNMLRSGLSNNAIDLFWPSKHLPFSSLLDTTSVLELVVQKNHLLQAVYGMSISSSQVLVRVAATEDVTSYHYGCSGRISGLGQCARPGEDGRGGIAVLWTVGVPNTYITSYHQRPL
ncbi:hypothetical protein ACJZ2D_011666 [Fusarium nematophilum]